MSINLYTNVFPTNSNLFLENDESQIIKNIAKSLEESSSEFIAQQSEKRKIESIKEFLERGAEEFETQQSAKRARIENAPPTITPSCSNVIDSVESSKYNFKLESTSSDELKTNKEFVLIALQNSGNDLEFASKELQNDKEIVLTAVQNSGNALRFASEKLKDDPEVVFAAVKHYGFPLLFASERLKNDKKFIMHCIKLSEFVLQFAGKIPRDDKEIILTAMKLYGEYPLVFASEQLKNDTQFLIECLKISKSPLRFASSKVQHALGFFSKNKKS